MILDANPIRFWIPLPYADNLRDRNHHTRKHGFGIIFLLILFKFLNTYTKYIYQ